jgi:hypothetical protein
MPREFRAYEVGRDGRIVRRIDFVCEDETGARHQARRLMRGIPVELWEGSKLIDRFEPETGSRH